jgi:O-succinylbenzoic acid--CoA ligase
VIIDTLTRTDPDVPLIRTPAGGRSRAEIREEVARTRDAFAGIAPGSVVGLLARVTPDTITTLLGAWAADLAVLLLDPRLPTHALRRTLRFAGARALLSGPDLTWELEDAPPREAVPRDGDDRVVSLVATSGTSGDPKLVAHSWPQHVASADGITEAADFGEGDAWLLSLPLHHVSGLAIVVRALVRGGTSVIGDDPSHLVETLATVKPTHLSVVSTQLQRAFQRDDTTEALRHVRCVLAGGGAIPLVLRERAVADAIPLMVSYGLTEMASTVTASADPDVVARSATGGTLLPRRRLEIGPDGVIRVGGETLCRGYLESNGVVNVTDESGWFTTGDVGRLDNGVLRILGRRDAMFVSGGENVHPGEIEGALLECPGVMAAVVVPVPDQDFGVCPVAFVEMGAHAAETIDLRRHLGERLPRFKIPEHLYRMPPSGGIKPDRGALRALAADPDRAARLESL